MKIFKKKFLSITNHLEILFYLILFGLVITGCQSQETVKIKKNNRGYELSNERVKVFCSVDENGYASQNFYAVNEAGEFEMVINSFKPEYPKHEIEEITKLYNTSISARRYLTSEIISEISIDKKTNSIIISGSKDSLLFEQRISLLPDAHNFHIDVTVKFPDSVNKIDYLLSPYQYNLLKPPFFVHTPSLKFDNEESKQNRFEINDSQDQVIGDRSYHSPAIILQEGALFCALVPDLNEINESRVISPDSRRKSRIPSGNIYTVEEVSEFFTLPTALDLNVKSGISEKPILSFGYMDAIISHHIRYNRVNDTSMIRTFKGNTLKYSFDLLLDANAKDYLKYSDVSKFIWQKYGHKEFKKGVHLAMPFKEYHRIIDSVTFSPSKHSDIDIPLEGYENTGSWLEWEDEKGTKMGGYRSSINWWNDKLHNSQFWNNAREASGLWYWGQKLKYQKDTERAQRIINWCLSAPQNKQGLFATLYNANNKTWALQFSDPMHGKTVFFLDKSDSYDVAAMSKTGAHLLYYFLNCEQDERITNYLKPYGDWLLTVIDERGSVPAYVSKNMEESDILRYSAHPAASAWFLAELYNATKESKYLIGSETIAKYLSNEIVPEAKWIDFEQFYSCGNRPLFFERDIVQNQIARGSLSVTWGAEAYAALHKATGSEQYLRNGEACVDYLSFFQSSWNPHYIYTAYPFGGVSSDNADSANYLDARQADCVKPFIYFGKQLGRQDLLERGVAAARSSIVLINHPLHKSNGIYEYTNIYPFGLGPENIDHEALPQSAMRTHPSWGEGSGIYTGLAEALRGLGGAYINLEKSIHVGVDGLHIEKVELDKDELKITVKSVLHQINVPWDNPYNTFLNIEGMAQNQYQLIINGNKMGRFSKEKLNRLELMIDSKGKISIN